MLRRSIISTRMRLILSFHSSDFKEMVTISSNESQGELSQLEALCLPMTVSKGESKGSISDRALFSSAFLLSGRQNFSKGHQHSSCYISYSRAYRLVTGNMITMTITISAPGAGYVMIYYNNKANILGARKNETISVYETLVTGH